SIISDTSHIDDANVFITTQFVSQFSNKYVKTTSIEITVISP
ncbi:hypothetical protein EVA_12976, partial [gut metagenome]